MTSQRQSITTLALRNRDFKAPIQRL